MTCNNYTCKLPVVGSGVMCILNSDWGSDTVNVLLLHDNQAWSGKFQIEDNEDVADLLDQLSFTKERYKEETKNALTTHGGAQHFAYTIEDDKFTWKKFMRANMAVKFGYITLLKVPVFEVFEQMIDNALHSNVKISEKLVKVEDQKDALEKENLVLKNKLNDLIKKKDEMETTLYGQFLRVLNEKKKKIEELKKKPGSDQNDSDKPQSDSDPFDSETDVDTEEEEKQSPSKDAVEDKDSLEIEDENIYTLPPKRLRRQVVGTEAIAGPSGCSRGRNATDSKLNDNVCLPILPKKSTPIKGRRNLEKNNCVAIKAEGNGKNNSEEDVFTFPKKSKRINSGLKLVKPSLSKINYVSDEETYFDKTQKIKIDSDSTPSELDVVNSGGKIIEIGKTDAKENTTEERLPRKSTRKTEKNDPTDTNNVTKDKTEYTNNISCKGYSSSTLDILNQLV